MHFTLFTSLIFSLVLTQGGTIPGLRDRERNLKPRACAHNNCLRALLGHRSAAVNFCDTYIPPSGTVTLQSTQTFTETLINQATQPFTTVTVTTTVTSPSVVPRAHRATTLPYFLSACNYNPTSISSACKCFITPEASATVVDVSLVYSVVIGTLTLPTQTITSTVTSTVA